MILLLLYATMSAVTVMVALALMAAASAVNAAMAAVTHPQPTTVTEPINAVKLLADFDPHFSSYMKVG